MKDKLKETFRLLLRLLIPNRKSGFTIVEVLLVAFILAILFAALSQTLNVGQIANIVSSEKIYLQSQTRRAIDWIVRDVRQTNLMQININSPSVNHIKFRKITGINNTNGEYAVDSNYTEYNYNNTSHRITRNELSADNSTLCSWVFHNITQSPFYTNITATPWVPLVDTLGVPGNILIAKKLIVVITGQRQARNSLLNLTLAEEVKIRNE